MPLTTPQRLSRAAIAAAVSTFVALASHVLGGGQMPAAAGVVVPLALSFAVSTQLAGRALSLWRLALAVTISQALFHTLFVLGAGGTSLSTSGHAHHGGAITVDAGAATVHGAHGGAAMTAAHLAAAIVTIVALHRAEWLLARGEQLLAWLGLARLIPRIGRPVSPPRLVRAVAPHATAQRVLADVALGVHSLRGPPLSIR